MHRITCDFPVQSCPLAIIQCADKRAKEFARIWDAREMLAGDFRFQM